MLTESKEYSSDSKRGFNDTRNILSNILCFGLIFDSKKVVTKFDFTKTGDIKNNLADLFHLLGQFLSLLLSCSQDNTAQFCQHVFRL